MDKIIKIPFLDIKVTKRLVIDLLLHFITTLIIAILLTIYSKNYTWFFLAFLGGVLIDTDHFIDYFLHLEKWNLESFLHGHFIVSRKLYLIFHAWELVILFAILSLYWNFFIVISTSMAGHLLIDTLMHALYSPFSYFFIYRLKHKFFFDKFNYYLFKRQLKNLKKAGLFNSQNEKKLNQP